VQDLLGSSLPDLGFDVGYLCVKPDRFARLRQSKDAPLWEVRVRHPWHGAAMRRIVRIVEQEGYELLHSHTPRSGWAALRVGRMLGLPVVHTIHDVSLGSPSGMARWFLNRYTKRVLKRADVVTAVSPATLSIAERYRLGVDRVLIRNGVPAAGPLPERTLPEEWVAGTVALLRPCKGIEVMVRALGRLRSGGRKTRFRIVGRFETGRYEREILGLVASLGVGDSIDFVGFSDDVPAELRRMDLFVMPSTGPEGLPMVLLEAMAHGLPVVGSDVAGVSDVVRDRVDGRIFAAGDDAALAAAVEEFIQGRTDWQRMRREAQRRHQQDFSAQRMAAQTAEVYRRLMAAARPACMGRA
jgi:glycosyltransferase involved in cell wall biosynthesis